MAEATFTEDILAGNNLVHDVHVAASNYTIGTIVEFSFSQPIDTAGTKKRKGICVENKTLADKGVLRVCVSGNVQRKNIVDITDTKANELSEFCLYAV